MREEAESGSALRAGAAALLSLVLPGAGHLGLGRPGAAAAWFLADLALTVGLLRLAVGLAVDGWSVALPLLLYQTFRVAVVIRAARLARRDPRPSRRRLLALTTLACLLIAAWFSFGLMPTARVIRDHVVEAFRVPTGGMSPTLLPGDRLLGDKRITDAPRRFEVVVYEAPGDDGSLVRYVHRVVGLPGEPVEYRDGVVWIDGSPLPERGREADPDSHPFGPARVPDGHYWVLGDRRSGSVDSRMPRIGFVPRERILARAAVIFTSVDPMSDEIRWERVGRLVR